MPLSPEGYREWQQEALTSVQPSVSAAPPPPPTCNQHSLGEKNKTGVKEHRGAKGAEEKFVVPTTSVGNFTETARICVVKFAVNLKQRNFPREINPPRKSPPPCSFSRGPQAGHKVLHTCTSWCAYAATCGSSASLSSWYTLVFHLTYVDSLLAFFCQHLSVCIVQYRLVSEGGGGGLSMPCTAPAGRWVAGDGDWSGGIGCAKCPTPDWRARSRASKATPHITARGCTVNMCPGQLEQLCRIILRGRTIITGPGCHTTTWCHGRHPLVAACQMACKKGVSMSVACT